MGTVLRARDPHLNRDLAVKVFRGSHAGPDLLRRFVEEAQVCSQLQHPSIVPVHDLGTLPDGRPFFAMKLVKGRTLADLLEERPGPGRDRPRFLKVFEQLCQAVAYAHSKGVIHRDLKPQNVMVGAFGEVQVMDWGLAKVLGSPGGEQPPDEGPVVSVVQTDRSGSSASESRPGSVMGTPAYMAPEQALGQVERLDRRCDVFGLGAILCEILTGRPPYVAPDGGTALRKAARADLVDAFARLDGCGADAELVALARRCLAAEPEGRPADAAAVADAVATYLAGVEERLRRAELERAQAQVKAAEERKRRKLVAVLAAALLLLLAGGGGGAWWLQQRRQAADAAVARAMDEARLLFEQAQRNPLAEAGKYPAALKAARQAEELASAGGASATVRAQAAALAAELEREVDAADRDRRLLTALLDVRGPREGPKFSRDARGVMVQLAEPSADEQFAAAFRAWGLDVDATPTEETAARLKGRPAQVVLEVVVALDEWASERRRRERPRAEWQRLADLATALEADPGSKQRELRMLLGRGRLYTERAIGGLARALLPATALIDVVPGEDRNRLRRLAEQTDPAAEPTLGLLTLARALRVAGDEKRAERLLRSALRARPQEVVLHTTLGEMLANRQPPQWREAVECYTAARALRPRLGASLAEALVSAGRVDEGQALFEQLQKEQPDNPRLSFVWGYVLYEQGRYRESEAACREAIRLKPDYYEAHNNLGLALNHQGRYRESEAACREAIRLKPDSAAAHNGLGVALHNQGRSRESEAACREAIRLKPDYYEAHNNLGLALGGQGRHKESEAAYREAIRLRPDDPVPHNNLGAVLNVQQRYKEAEAALLEAIRLKPDYYEALSNLGHALSGQNRFREAEAGLRAALRLRPDDPGAHKNLGALWNVQQRYKEAEAALRKAVRLKPDDPGAHSNLGNALNGRRRFREAEAAYREAIRLQPEDPRWHIGLSNALSGQGRFREARAAYAEALRLAPPGSLIRRITEGEARRCERRIELEGKLPAVLRGDAEPADAAERLALADLCHHPAKRLHAAAARLYADAFAAAPKLALDMGQQPRYSAACSAALAAAGQGEDARLLPDKVAARLRRQAHDWLKADLALYAQIAQVGNPGVKRVIESRLGYWRQDEDLASVRDRAALERLPEAERQAWQQLWADADALLKKVTEAGPPP
jgi:serine/threonine-protein kinase